MTLLQSPTASTAPSPRGEPAISTMWLTTLLIAASVVELTILRVGTRTVIHIPNIEAVADPYKVVAATGRLAFFSALVLLSLLLATMVIERYRSADAYPAAAISIFLFAAVGEAAGISGWPTAMIAVVVAALGSMIAVRVGPPIAFVVGAFIVGYLLSATQSMSQADPIGGLIPGLGAAGSLRLAEALTVGAAICSWPTVRWLSGRHVQGGARLGWMAVAAGISMTLLLAGRPATTTVLMMWNFGLTGALPALLYGLATTSVVLTLGSCARGSGRRVAAALALLILGGLGLTSTYQSGLTVAGLALMLPILAKRTDRAVDELSIAA